MIISHNMSAMFTHRSLGLNDRAQTKTMEKLSSGYRINRAGDDPAGLAVSEKMRAQTAGLRRASKNAQDGISFLQTADGYLQGTTSALQRIRELSVQAANGTYSDEDRAQISVEVEQLVDEVNRIASHAQFNGMNLLTGRFAGAQVTTDAEGNVTGNAQDLWLHIGANMDQREQVTIGNMSAKALGLTDEGGMVVGVKDTDTANRSIGIVDVALLKVNKQRADIGAYQNRIEKAQDTILIAAENLQSAESQIRDADMAEESVELAKNNILVQTATAMLANANSKTQGVLQLLR